MSHHAAVYERTTEQQTPTSNTGSIRHEGDTGIVAHLDYLVVVTQNIDLDSTEKLLHRTLGTTFDWSAARPGTIGRYYELVAAAPTGVSVAIAPEDNKGRRAARLSIPGKPLSTMSAEVVQVLGTELLRQGWTATRLDWAMDDYGRTFELETVIEALEQGNFWGARSYSVVLSRADRKSEPAMTAYLGAPGSDKRVRIYDKRVESEGEMDCIRVEVQYRDELAQHYFVALFAESCYSVSIGIVSRKCISQFGFVLRDNEVLSRCPTLSWWLEFVSKIGEAVKTSVPRKPSLLPDKLNWIERQVAGTLATIKRCLGNQAVAWLLNCIERASIQKARQIENFYQNWEDGQKQDPDRYLNLVNMLGYAY